MSIGKYAPLSVRTKKPKREMPVRMQVLRTLILVAAALLVVRLFYIQVIRHDDYAAQAANQHELTEELLAMRGTIFMQDYETESLVPVATTQNLGFVFVNPSEIEDLDKTIEALINVLDLKFDEKKEAEEVVEEEVVDEEVHIVGTELDSLTPAPEPEEELTVDSGTDQTEYERFVERLSDKDDPYEPIARGVIEERLSILRDMELPGVHYTREPTRLYPEEGIGGHVIGFLGRDSEGEPIGRYGIEGYWENDLAGENGYSLIMRDIGGRLIALGDRSYKPANDGAEIVLTIDRTIQYMACKKLRESVLQHGAEGGSVIVMDPKTGDILAMCGYPDFSSSSYSDVDDLNTFNNPATFEAYEPGSIFKAITMAAALDRGSVSPSSTFEDTGEIKVPPFTIHNSDRKAHGEVTMTEVLEKSLNTGIVYAMEQAGSEMFKEYVEKFGFGEPVGLPVDTEVGGNISSLDKRGDIYSITASYGQGITVTPAQMAQAYGAIANEGVMMKPRLVKEIRYPDGVVKYTDTQALRRVISKKTSTLLGAMLVSVIENGHAKGARVPGYFLAGKTGTAQIAEGGKYIKGETIGSFVGFGPVDDPAFVMITRIDRPENDLFSASTAAPLFGDIASFLLEYLNIPPDRN